MRARLDAIGVIVSDLKRSIDFYRRLGLEFPENPDPEGHGHVETTLDAGIRLMFDSIETIHSFDPDWTPPTGGHRIALAFMCESPGELDALFAELIEIGGRAHKAPWNAFWGQRYAEVEDPDGNVVDLFAPLPD